MEGNNGVKPSQLAYPAEQLVHLLEPEGLYCPAGHAFAVALAAPAWQKNPAEQFAHAVSPAPLYKSRQHERPMTGCPINWTGAHCQHPWCLWEPLCGGTYLNVPAGHCAAEGDAVTDPGGHAKPAVQFAQLLAPAALYWPAGHSPDGGVAVIDAAAHA